MSDGTEKSDAQRQDGRELRHRREEVVTQELVAHGARGNAARRTPEKECTAEEERGLADKQELEEAEKRERMVARRREVEKRMRR